MPVQPLVLDTLVTGLPYVLPFLGIWLVFRLLGEIDLTVDASFTLGAAVTAVGLANGWGVAAAMTAAAVAGAVAGLVTTVLHVALRVPVLLAGIVMWIGMYSVNLRVMERPTLAVPQEQTLYAPLQKLSGDARDVATAGMLTSIVLVALLVLAGWLHSEHGLAVRVAGANRSMARRYGVDDRRMVGAGLMVCNALAASGGALVAQGQGFVEVNMGFGLAIAGVAAVLVGELVLPARASQVVRAMVAVCVGALVYRAVLVGALRAGLPATDLRLVIALMLIAAMVGHRFLRSSGKPACAGVGGTAHVGAA